VYVCSDLKSQMLKMSCFGTNMPTHMVTFAIQLLMMLFVSIYPRHRFRHCFSSSTSFFSVCRLATALLPKFLSVRSDLDCCIVLYCI